MARIRRKIEKKAAPAGTKIQLKYVRSAIATPEKHKLVVKGLGFTRLNQVIEREDTPFRLRQCNAERDRQRQPHAAQHVEILRTVAGRPEVEIGVADAADHGFLVLQSGDQARGEVETVHHLGIAGRGCAVRGHGSALTCQRLCRR